MTLQINTITKPDTTERAFLAKLRQRTSDAHTRLEQLPLSANLISSSPDISHYITYLEVMYKVVSDVENQIFPLVNSEFPDLQHRMKAHMLADDLATLNGKAETAHVFSSGKELSHTASFAMGIMYVIEGSTLGGRVIIKTMQPVLEAAARGGFSYFAGYGSETGSRWKSFLQALTTFVTNNNTEEEVIAGAIYAFNVIHDLIKAAGNHENN